MKISVHTSCLVLVAMVTLVRCEKYTVTDEAWFEVSVSDNSTDKELYRKNFTIAVFGKSAPMTTMNFVAIVKGYKKNNEMLHYKNTPVHRIVQDFVIQMGDITRGDGTGGKSIFGEKFADEDFVLSHRSAGWVSMANHGTDTNGSQFFILLTRARWLDGKHVVFGKVINGFSNIKALGDMKSNTTTGVPYNNINIVNCGLNKLDSPYELPEQLLDSEEDL